MKTRLLRQEPGLYIDIGLTSVKVWLGDRELELPVERGGGGELSGGTRERLRDELRAHLDATGRSQARVLCGLPARGVTLRRFTLPPGPGDEMRRLLLMQLESTFPLPPEQLAWGYSASSGSDGVGPNVPRPLTEAVILALRRQVVDDYAELLADCGLRPTFLLGVLAASRLCRTPNDFELLDIGRTHSELLRFKDRQPWELRSLAFGGNTVNNAISKVLQLSPEEAEELKLDWQKSVATDGAPVPSEIAEVLPECVRAAAGRLVQELKTAWSKQEPVDDLGLPATAGRDTGKSLFLSGGGARLPGIAEVVRRAHEPTADCRVLEDMQAPPCSSVLRGLRLVGENGDQDSTFTFLTTEMPRAGKAIPAAQAARLWLAAAVVLGLLCLLAPPIIRLSKLPRLRADVAAIEEIRRGLPSLDQELAFLELVETSQTPYMEALTAVAEAAPKGTQVTNLNMNRAGEVALRGTIGDYQKANEFRRQLALSAAFSQVVLQELTPKDPKKKVWEFRLRARLAGVGERR